ncbi:MAG: glycosyltransferase family 4 protein [Bryobacteraceae bacterium]
MRIALDATYGVGNQLSGVGVYSREISRELAASHPEARFLWCYRAHRFLRALGEPVPSNCRRRLLQEPLGPRSAAVFHGLNQRLPRMKLRRTVTTFHDLFVLTGDYSTPEFRRRFAAQARDAAARSDLIIAVSEFTAWQVQSLLGVERGRLRVVHHGIRPSTATATRERIILHVGAMQHRKNIVRLVEAFERVSREWKLVLAGSAGFGAGEILARIDKSSARDRIVVAGYAADLGAWYARAGVFAFPSLDEGFGMPVLEAMAAGVPVLTSIRSALPEVSGDAALLIDPERTGEIAEGLRKLTEDEGLRKEFVERGKVRAAQFTWTGAARKTWEVYRELAR